jgi:CMP/dCMP kinase
MIIAIDGPSGAGKGTVARAIAARLGCRHVDSGAMYRAVAWKALHDGLSLDAEAAVSALAEASRIEFQDSRVLIDNIDVTRAIRTPEIDKAAASVARLPAVRAVLVARQRVMGAGGIVMEGRDIGTKVFPNADVKIFLDADPSVRGDRRFRQQGNDGDPKKAEALVAELRERDHRDRTRATSPLVAAADAIVIDSTKLSIDDVLEKVEAAVASAAANK